MHESSTKIRHCEIPLLLNKTSHYFTNCASVW